MNDKKDMAFDTNGNKMPYSPDEVLDKALNILQQGDLILVISKIGDSLAVNVLGPPSRETLNMLEQAVEAYRNIINKQGL